MPMRLLATVLALATAASLAAAPAHKVLLLTGQSNRYHDWLKSYPVVQRHLEHTDLFQVDVSVTPGRGGEFAGFAPKFSTYAAVVLIYEGDEWPEATKAAFVAYMRDGGGLVTVHDSDNAFPYWKEFNEMIGVGGWGFKKDGNIGARDATWGPKIRWRDGKLFLDSTTPGNASHPPRHDFALVARAPDHPILRGLSATWLHANDEIYSHLRGPAKNVTVLATALADQAKYPSASGEHEPMLMTISYGKGRIFHTTLGHVGPNDKPPYASIECAGFATTLQRGTEWAATGKVTQKSPADFPTAEKTSLRD